jgi:hypothetical protein
MGFIESQASITGFKEKCATRFAIDTPQFSNKAKITYQTDQTRSFLISKIV